MGISKFRAFVDFLKDKGWKFRKDIVRGSLMYAPYGANYKLVDGMSKLKRLGYMRKKKRKNKYSVCGYYVNILT